MTAGFAPTDRRRAQVLATLAEILVRAAAAGRRFVVVDDGAGCSARFADDLASAVRSGGSRCARLADAGAAVPDDGLVLAAGPHWRSRPPDVTIFLRTPPATAAHRHRDAHSEVPGHAHRNADGAAHGDGEHNADVIIDHHDAQWPVIRHVSPSLDHPAEQIYLSETQAFFAARAFTWNAKFGDDLPAYERAIQESDVPAGATIIDVGCGTGRALPALRAVAGDTGTVIGIDVTPEMLTVASIQFTGHHRHLVQADARRLPLPTASVDAVFAAGLVQHLPDPVTGLEELARVARPGGRLIIFHPSGRAALAARHGRSLRPDEPLAHDQLEHLLRRSGWELLRYDDPPHRFFALARRVRA